MVSDVPEPGREATPVRGGLFSEDFPESGIRVGLNLGNPGIF